MASDPVSIIRNDTGRRESGIFKTRLHGKPIFQGSLTLSGDILVIETSRGIRKIPVSSEKFSVISQTGGDLGFDRLETKQEEFLKKQQRKLFRRKIAKSSINNAVQKIRKPLNDVERAIREIRGF